MSLIQIIFFNKQNKLNENLHHYLHYYMMNTYYNATLKKILGIN